MKIVGEMNYFLVIDPTIQLLRKQLARKAKDNQKSDRNGDDVKSCSFFRSQDHLEFGPGSFPFLLWHLKALFALL
jgi:hypothetical protein